MSVATDASVAVKWVFEEPGSAIAVALLRTGQELCAPELLRIETAAAIIRRFRMGAISDADARERLQHAEKLISEKRVRYLADRDLLPRAQEIALQIKHPLQDCLYVACAERVKGELITVDPKLLARASPQFPFVRPL